MTEYLHLGGPDAGLLSYVKHEGYRTLISIGSPPLVAACHESLSIEEGYEILIRAAVTTTREVK